MSLAKVSDWWKTVKNQSALIWLISRHQSEWIRTNPKPSFQFRSIRINPRSEWFGLIPVENSVWINPSSNWFGLIWIGNLISDCFRFIRIIVSESIGLRWIDFWPFFIKRDTKCFSDWSGMIRIGSDIDIGMNRNSSDWLGMNFNPILPPRVITW